MHVLQTTVSLLEHVQALLVYTRGLATQSKCTWRRLRGNGRVSNQNGISRLYIIVEKYHSGRKFSLNVTVIACCGLLDKRPSNMPVYLRDGPRHTTVRAATLR